MARGRRLLGQLGLVLAVMAAAFLGAKLGLLGTREVTASHNFSDVPDSAFFHDFVQFLVDNGITSGCGGGRFCGEDPVTRGQMAVFLQRLAALTCLRREGTDVIFEGCNVHIRSGAGATDAAVNGLGNLIVGYNEDGPPGFEVDVRTGSHNLVVGRFHTYSSFGGFVAGRNNAVSGPSASVSGGQDNTASGPYASVSGGLNNTASSIRASVSGGENNTASGFSASVSGGDGNTASGSLSSVSGGAANEANGFRASISGGQSNTASGQGASVSGGGGNTASGTLSSVSGGGTRFVSGEFDWRAGALFEDF
jgi:hypothetical protein